jgi:hypothetical protein
MKPDHREEFRNEVRPAADQRTYGSGSGFLRPGLSSPPCLELVELRLCAVRRIVQYNCTVCSVLVNKLVVNY